MALRSLYSPGTLEVGWREEVGRVGVGGGVGIRRIGEFDREFLREISAARLGAGNSLQV